MVLTFSRKISGLILIMIFSLSLGCFHQDKKDQDKKNQAAANTVVPSAGTMTFDYSTFSAINARAINDVQERTNSNLTTAEVNCWFTGTLYVVWATAICYTPLAIPFGVFGVLTSQIPSEFSAGHIKWSYTWKENLTTSHSAVVTADKNSAGDGWVWTIAINGFQWLTGESKTDKTSGWWQFHDPRLTAGADNTILVEWTYTDSIHKSVKFSLNNTGAYPTGYGHGEYGDFIIATQSGSDFSVEINDFRSDVTGGTNNGPLLDFTVNWSASTQKGNITVNSGTLTLWGNTQLSSPGGQCTFDPTTL